MSFLFLIRHGQASANATDYDQLSALGYQQSERIGLALAKKKIQHVYVGPRKRHWQTHHQAVQPNWPTPKKTPQLDEFPAHDLMYKALDQLIASKPKLAKYAKEIHQHVGSNHKAFDILLRTITEEWAAGKIVHPEIESFLNYQDRLQAFLLEIQQLNSSGDIVAFTSAGTISSLIGLVLDADPVKAMRMAWSVFNGSITAIRIHQKEQILAGFNNIEHIDKNARTLL